MESINLATLIVGAICVIGMIELIMWIVVVIKHPGCESFRLETAAGCPPSTKRC